MKLEAKVLPDWPDNRIHHLWVDGDLLTVLAVTTWLRDWCHNHDTSIMIAGPTKLYSRSDYHWNGEYPKHLNVTPKVIGYRIIAQTDKEIDPILVKLATGGKSD